MRTADLTTTFNQPLGKTHPITTEERETGNLNSNSLVALVSDLGPLQRCQEIPSSFPPASQFQLKKKKKKLQSKSDNSHFQPDSTSFFFKTENQWQKRSPAKNMNMTRAIRMRLSPLGKIP